MATKIIAKNIAEAAATGDVQVITDLIRQKLATLVFTEQMTLDSANALQKALGMDKVSITPESPKKGIRDLRYNSVAPSPRDREWAGMPQTRKKGGA